MNDNLIYVELKSGRNHNGPAWIGRVQYSKNKRTVYFNGKAFQRIKGVVSNYRDIETGDEYWISGLKKNSQDRHWAGSGKIMIDKEVVDDYLKYIGNDALDKTKYQIVELDNSDIKKRIQEIENRKLNRNSR